MILTYLLTFSHTPNLEMLSHLKTHYGRINFLMDFDPLLTNQLYINAKEKECQLRLGNTIEFQQGFTDDFFTKDYPK